MGSEKAAPLSETSGLLRALCIAINQGLSVARLRLLTCYLRVVICFLLLAPCTRLYKGALIISTEKLWLPVLLSVYSMGFLWCV